MCKFSNEQMQTPKIVGETIVAGITARYDNGIPVKTKVFLRGYNTAVQKVITFASSIPEQTEGWCGMPMEDITSDMVGAWRMSWETVDEYGKSCSQLSGFPDLVITDKVTKMYFTSDKVSIDQGQTITFSGYYKAGETVYINDITDFISKSLGSVQCDNLTAFQKSFVITLPIGRRKIQAIAGGIFQLFSDTAEIYITVNASVIPPEIPATYQCNTPFDGWETDQYGNTRKATRCNPLTPSVWKCIEPKNGYAKDQYGNSKQMAGCEVDAAASIWKCSKPKDGYTYDQYGNKKLSVGCNPNTDFDLDEFLEEYGLYIGIGVVGFILIILLIMRK